MLKTIASAVKRKNEVTLHRGEMRMIRCMCEVKGW